MKQPAFRAVLIVCGLALLFCAQAFAQATIVGTVTDPSGGAVPGATIAITNTDTNQTTQMTTNADGQFVAPDLHVGKYQLHVTAPGFKPIEQKNVTLAVGDRLRSDFKLELGQTEQQITVEAAPVAVQSQSGEVSNVITGTQVTQLSTNGRSLYTLAQLTPGASGNLPDFQAPVPTGGNANISFNGQRPGHNLYMIDGGEDLDRGGSGNISVMPSVDAIAEFRDLTSNYSAEYGISSAATMSMIFKSGTKDFHGEAWEFVRNDAFDAGNFFTNAAGQKAPKLNFNLFGFNVGGPVTLGKLYNKDRNKTFFFYNMEWRRLVQGTAINQTVPPVSSYGGDLGATPIHVPAANQLSPDQIARFASVGLTPGAPFPNNTIPAALLDPNAQALLKAGIFPAPTAGSQFNSSANAPTNVTEEVVRIDHRFSDKFNIFGHWVSEQISQGYATTQWSGDNVPSVGDTFGNPSYSAVFHAINTISPTLINEAAFNYNGNRIHIVPNGLIARPAGFTTPVLFGSTNNLNRIPNIDLTGSTGTQYEVSSWPWNNAADSYQGRDDISWVHGTHQFKFGVSYLRYQKVQDLFGQTQGAFNFNGKYTGNDFADFLLGYANQYTQLALQDAGHWNSNTYSAYIQDNWRVTNRLTLNLGLRWDGMPHTYEANGRMGNFYPSLYDPSKPAVLLPDGTISPNSPGLGKSPSSNPLLQSFTFYLNGIGIPGQNGIDNGLVQNHWANFGPRFGFAYDLTGRGRTVLRGGFGAMYERIQGNDMYDAAPNIPYSAQVTLPNVSLSNPNLSLLTGQPLATPITPAAITALSNTDYKNPVDYQYSFGVQQGLGANSVFSLAYVGAQGRHQSDYRETNLPSQTVLPSLIAGTVNYNTVLPYLGFGSIKMAENAENSHYNSLQASLTGQFKKDLTLQVAYTYSRAIDPTTGINGNGYDLDNVSNPYNRAYDYGPSIFNRTHVAIVNFVYQLPFFRATTNHALRTGLGGWEISGIVTAETGLPINILLGGPAASNGLQNATNRPDGAAAVQYLNGVQWFAATPTTAASGAACKGSFCQPTPGLWGTLGYNAVQGPGRTNFNISVFKSFVFNERGSRLEFRAETFNTFNHTQWNNVSNTFSNSNFGQVTSAFDPRTFQFGLKLYL